MSEETPNKSEERLQRYAKERRAQGGDFALHPATRRMLQGEVARTLGTKEPAAKSRGWLAWLNSWSGRLAVGATAAVVITGSWILWNGTQDRHALQLAKAEMPMRKSELAATGGSRALVNAEKALVQADASVVRAELEKKAAPATPPMTMLVAAPAQLSDNDAGKTATDKLAAVDSLAKDNVAITFQEQSVTTSFFGSAATLSLAPVAANYSIANAPTDAQKPDSRNPQTFNYANAAGQTFTLAGQTAGNASDAYQKQLMEADVHSRVQGGSQLAMQDNALSAPESRARFSRPAPPGAPVPTTPPAAVNLARSQESLARNGESLRGALAASGAAASATQDAASSRSYRSNAVVNDPARSKALASTARVLGESLPVLSNFIIEQKGTSVRVVDGDGSVYDGTVETPPRPGFVPGKDAADGPVRDILPGEKTETAPRHQELSFRAAGSNVTLRQSVVVNARFSPGTDAGRAGQATPAEAPSKQRDLAARRAAPQTAQASNLFTGQYGATTNATSTIEGTVRIGTTNQQWFRATRRGP